MRIADLVSCLCARLAPAPLHAAEPVSVELILDCSGSMWNKPSDGRYRIDAAKEVLSQFIATAPDNPDLHIGLRLYGSKIPYRKPGAASPAPNRRHGNPHRRRR